MFCPRRDVERDIGIFLAIPSSSLRINEDSIQGLCHLLSSNELSKRIVIAIPSWAHDQFDKLLKEIPNIEKSSLELVYAKKNKSFLAKILQILILNDSPASQTKKHLSNSLLHNIYNRCINFASINTLCFILTIPLLFFCFLYYKILKKIESKTNNPFSRLIKNLLSSKRIVDFLNKVNEIAEKKECDKLIIKINNKKEVKVWYMPIGNWLIANKITANKVFAINDIVYHETKLKTKSKFICYSQYIKKKHLRFHQVRESDVLLMKWGYNDLSLYLTKPGLTLTESSIQIINKYQAECLHNDAYLSDFHLPSMKFIFFPFQIRSHKNAFNLIKAYQNLLRNKFVNVKLVMLGNVNDEKEIHKYVIQNRLQYDVIFFHEISPEVKAALHHLALCAVNPSIFEGSFPFTFCEAYTVGTPSVMSRINVTLEESVDASINTRMLFDPCSIEDIVSKIEWAVNNRSKLFEMQQPLFEKLSKQTWKKSAEDHLNLFNELIQTN